MLSCTRQIVNTLNRKSLDTFQRESYKNVCRFFHVVADETNLDTLVLPHSKSYSIDTITSIYLFMQHITSTSKWTFYSLHVENYLNKIFPAFTKSANLFIKNNIWIGRNFSRGVYLSILRIPYLFLSLDLKSARTHTHIRAKRAEQEQEQTNFMEMCKSKNGMIARIGKWNEMFPRIEIVVVAPLKNFAYVPPFVFIKEKVVLLA